MPTWSRHYDGLEIVLVPWRDNYFYLLALPDGDAAVVDPGAAEPVQDVLAARRWRLAWILITHGDRDHVDGVADLVRAWHPRVVEPASSEGAGPVATPAGVRLGPLDVRIIATPGHANPHVAYHLPAPAPGILFAGDCLMGAGCGRVRDGAYAAMYRSLRALAACPESTHVYCGHEYTVENLQFAREVDPENKAVERRAVDAAALRAQGEPTLPTTIGLERATNPFLRAASLEDFTALRRRKDVF